MSSADPTETKYTLRIANELFEHKENKTGELEKYGRIVKLKIEWHTLKR